MCGCGSYKIKDNKKHRIFFKALEDICIGNAFPNSTSIGLQITARIEGWDCTKVKCFRTAKERISRIKRQLQNGENLCQLVIR
jgi:hypothetical protein